MTTQLRRYQLSTDAAEQDRWLEWWVGARAVRVQYGFRIVSAVLDRETGIFVWVVEHDDFAAAEPVMLASPERASVFSQDRPAMEILETPFVERIV